MMKASKSQHADRFQQVSWQGRCPACDRVIRSVEPGSDWCADTLYFVRVWCHECLDHREYIYGIAEDESAER